MTAYLLDANLSPKIARFLSSRLGLNVLSLTRAGQGELPDHDVMRLATSLHRVIITLDRDFAMFSHRFGRATIGIIYLDLPNELRTIPAISQLLETFFKDHAPSIDLEHSLVVITENEVRISRAR